jgi:hypothetical protein
MTQQSLNTLLFVFGPTNRKTILRRVLRIEHRNYCHNEHVLMVHFCILEVALS